MLQQRDYLATLLAIPILYAPEGASALDTCVDLHRHPLACCCWGIGERQDGLESTHPRKMVLAWTVGRNYMPEKALGSETRHQDVCNGTCLLVVCCPLVADVLVILLQIHQDHKVLPNSVDEWGIHFDLLRHLGVLLAHHAHVHVWYVLVDA